MSGLSRFEGEIHAADGASIDEVELLKALATGSPSDEGRRQAIACFLSGGQGWKDAAAHLGGAFAGTVEKATGLTGGKGK